MKEINLAKSAFLTLPVMDDWREPI